MAQCLKVAKAFAGPKNDIKVIINQLMKPENIYNRSFFETAYLAKNVKI
jgi:hypothetical protein